MPTAEPIEASYTDETPAFTPSVAAPGPDRADVLTQLRKLVAEATGVAALVESAAGKVRPEFIAAWRAWFGLLLGRHIDLERRPFNVADADAEVARWQQRLATWRAGLAAELPVAAPAGAPTDAAPQTIAPPTGARAGWPRWAVWLGIGGGVLLLWKVGQWLLGPSYSSTSQVVADVAQTADAVNDVRKERR